MHFRTPGMCCAPDENSDSNSALLGNAIDCIIELLYFYVILPVDGDATTSCCLALFAAIFSDADKELN